MKRKITLLSTLLILVVVFCSIFAFNASAETTPAAEGTAPQLGIYAINLKNPTEGTKILYAVTTNAEVAEGSLRLHFYNNVVAGGTYSEGDIVVLNPVYRPVNGVNCYVFEKSVNMDDITPDLYARASLTVDGVTYYSQMNKYSAVAYCLDFMGTEYYADETYKGIIDGLLAIGNAAQYTKVSVKDYFGVSGVTFADGFGFGYYAEGAELSFIGLDKYNWVDTEGKDVAAPSSTSTAGASQQYFAKLSNADFNDYVKALDSEHHSEVFAVSGMVTSVSGKNCFIIDESGSTVQIYGSLKDLEGNTVTLTAGMDVTVKGNPYNYNGKTPEMENPVVLASAAHEHTYTTLANKCDVCGEIIEHTCENNDADDLCDLCGEKMPVAGQLVGTYDATAQGYANAESVDEIPYTILSGENTVATLTFDNGTGSTTPKYYTSGTAIRFYQSNTITVVAPEGYQLISVVITHTQGNAKAFTADKGTCTLTNLENAWAPDAGTVVSELIITNTSGAQSRFTTIVVTVAPVDCNGNHTYTELANKCDVCGEISEHTCVDALPEGALDSLCDLCGEAVAHTCEREFDCSIVCKICGVDMERTVDCKYDNCQDETCNVCGLKNRESAACVDADDNGACDNCAACLEHRYTDLCDTECNNCTETREAPHLGLVTCGDTTCRTCGLERTATNCVDADEDKVCDVCGAAVTEGSLTLENATVDLTLGANRVSYSTTQQVWAANGVTITNDKASSSTNNYQNAEGVSARLYASSTVTIAGQGITKIVINCGSTTYMKGMSTDIPGATVTEDKDAKTYTIVLTEAVDSITLTMSGQNRVNTVVVNPTEAA